MKTEPQKLQLTQNAPLSLESVRNPLRVGDHTVMCWCPVVHYGGIYFIESGLWHTFGPFEDYESFKRFLGNAFPEALEKKQ
ncbi:MAG: hypothetical protein AAF756_10860 [Pseudomonadota bacterium]